MNKKVLLLGAAVLVLSFQNCSNSNFTSFGAVEDSMSFGSLSLSDTLVETEMNTPVQFEVTHARSLPGAEMQFEAADSSRPLNGSIEVVDAASFKFNYSPNWGFRGTDRVVVRVKDRYGAQESFNITVVVGNALHSLQPALAIRGMGCVQCHAQVSSSIITDFGYGNEYYFGQKPAETWWKSGGVYGDHGNSFDTMVIPADKALIVPKAALPSVVAASQGLLTLGEYVRGQLEQSATESTRSVQVQEKGKVYIGAPEAKDILEAFKMSDSDRLRYFKDSDSSPDLAGLKDQGDFFQNSGVLSCEGDLALRGPLLLDNLQLKSKSGCRLYVIGSVFIFGGISYVNQDEKRNLQITSTKSISLGLGSVKKGDAFCAPEERYATHTASYGTSSLANRYTTFWTVPGNFVRQTSDPKLFGESVLAEAALIEKKAGVLYDASCREEGRKVSFERILLNAPAVHSRYEGDVSGTIIAEFSIMSLGKFKFSFDEVFKKVPVFPFLDSAVYLEVSD